MTDPQTGIGEPQTIQRLQRPPMYRVIMENDNFTPMEFVVQILRLVFGYDTATSTAIMLTVHKNGSAVCGVYPHEIAETLAGQVVATAARYDHPLLARVERDDAGEGEAE
ncbi:MAG: ATP-dependent Clp protease adaptor ClpS [Gammaproteobacteria bacterium AqS3]|nr:ATP-dependent Clp protease adaptor ClpS [Gammaproteobacteria bacterium AqS3]